MPSALHTDQFVVAELGGGPLREASRQHIKRSAYTRWFIWKSCLKEYVESHNKNPQPFVWPKAVDEILKKIERAKKALLAH